MPQMQILDNTRVLGHMEWALPDIGRTNQSTFQEEF